MCEHHSACANAQSIVSPVHAGVAVTWSTSTRVLPIGTTSDSSASAAGSAPTLGTTLASISSPRVAPSSSAIQAAAAISSNRVSSASLLEQLLADV